MPSNYTENYNLNQWEADDKVERADFNADNAKIDAAIKAVDQRVDSLSASKADASALSALSQVVAGKGNCRVVTGQYTGTGMRGQAYPCTLAFDHKPLVLMVAKGNVMIAARGGNGYVLNNGGSSYVSAVWEDKSVSWYTDVIDANPSRQMNTSGVVYTYVVLLEL